MIWHDWWEVHRDDYLKPRKGTLTGELTPPPPPNVLPALIKAAGSKNFATRASAALAMGMVREGDAFGTLRVMLRDPVELVAIRAWASIGLINTPQAAAFLEKPPQRKVDQIGWLLAIGLHEHPTDATWANVLKAAQQTDDVEIHRWVIWAISIHKPTGAHELLQKIAWESNDPALFCDAVEDLAEFADPQDLPLLEQILRPVSVENAPAIVPRIDGRLPRRTDRLPLAVTNQLHRLQAAAADAAGRFPKLDTATYEALRQPLLLRLQDTAGIDGLRRSAGFVFSPGYESSDGIERLIALGRIADIEDVATLCRVANLFDPSVLDPRYRPDDPFPRMRSGSYLRQASLLALALYYRQHGGRAGDCEQSAVTGTSAPAVSRFLQGPFSDPGEYPFIRVECAIGMAIGGDPRDVEVIRPILQRASVKEESVASFGLLAMGMLGAPETLEMSRHLLLPEAKVVNVPAILELRSAYYRIPNGLGVRWPHPEQNRRRTSSQRAVVDGLGALGDPQAIPLLIGQWGYFDLLSLSVARSIAWCRYPTVDDGSMPEPDLIVRFSNSLVGLLNDPPPTEATSAVPVGPVAAMSLGLLWDHNASSRLSLICKNEMVNDKLLSHGAQSDFDPIHYYVYPLRDEIFALTNTYYHYFRFGAIIESYGDEQ